SWESSRRVRSPSVSEGRLATEHPVLNLALPYGRASGTLRPANKLRREPTHRNQNNHVNPVVSTSVADAKVITDHEEDHGTTMKVFCFERSLACAASFSSGLLPALMASIILRCA